MALAHLRARDRRMCNVSDDFTSNAEPLDPYDAILLVSFGGPEAPEDVQPFLENVSATSARTTTSSAAGARSTISAAGSSPRCGRNWTLVGSVYRSTGAIATGPPT